MHATLPALPPNSWPEVPARDDFRDEALRPEWLTLRVPAAELGVRLEEGGLVLPGREALMSRHHVALVGRRLQSLHGRLRTELSVDPRDFQQMAGVCAYYDSRNWVYARVSRDEAAGRALNVTSCENGVYREHLSHDVPVGNQVAWVWKSATAATPSASRIRWRGRVDAGRPGIQRGPAERRALRRPELHRDVPGPDLPGSQRRAARGDLPLGRVHRGRRVKRTLLALLTAALAAHAGALTSQAAAEAQARAILPRLTLDDKIGQVSMAHVFRFTEGAAARPSARMRTPPSAPCSPARC